jgi:hypothetical protein
MEPVLIGRCESLVRLELRKKSGRHRWWRTQKGRKSSGRPERRSSFGWRMDTPTPPRWLSRSIGVLSNVEGERPLQLPKLSPGRHLIRVLQVWLYHTEPSGVKSEVARGLEAECEFESTDQRVIALDLRFDGETLSIQANEQR